MSVSSITQNIYTVITLINMILAISVIFIERRNVGVTWAWLMVFLFFPVGGFIIYLIFGQNLSRLKIYKDKKWSRKLHQQMTDHQKKEFRQHRIEYNDPSMSSYEDLIYMNLSSAKALFTQDNSVQVFKDGNEKFYSLYEDIRTAKTHVHLMYYIINDDSTGRRLLELLREKAEQGVEVRFLYDPIGSHRLSTRVFQPLIRAGGQVAAFFPSKVPYLNFRVNYRNHRKLAIIDGEIGYIGGINVGDEYLGLVPKFGYWRDTHLRMTGSAVRMMQGHFIRDWNTASKRQLVETEFFLPPVRDEEKGDIGVQIVASGPDQSYEHIRNAYIKMIHRARESVWIQTPYFVPDESLINAIQTAALSGVNVKMIIPAIADHQMVYWATHSYVGDLLPLGVECYLYENGFLHAKTLIIDGKVASVGTANFDIRSFKLNFEINAFLYDREIVKQLEQNYLRDIEHSRLWTYEEYLKRPWMHRLRESVTRLLSPIL